MTMPAGYVTFPGRTQQVVSSELFIHKREGFLIMAVEKNLLNNIDVEDIISIFKNNLFNLLN